MKKILNIALLAVLALSFSACEKYLDDKFENPNLVSEAPINPLFATATYGTAMNEYRLGYNVSYLTQYQSSSSQGSDADIYNEVDYSTTWRNFYSTMMNISEMNKLAEKTSAYYHLGVGKLLMAYNLNMLITAFGDVPYSESLKGLDELTPAFDNQQTLHATTLQLVEEGITNLERTDALAEIDKPSDVIHGGNVAAWLKTAYAMKARFLNQLSKTGSYNSTDILSALESAYESNNDDATATAFDGLSPWNSVAVDNANLNLDGWLSTNIVNAMNGTTYGVFDPRLPLIATITKFGDYRGTRNGAGRIGTGTDDEESYLSLDGFYSKGGAPLQLVTYAEMKFIEAEAAFRAGDKETAYNAYLAGIAANMDKIGVSSADKQTYINDPVVSVGKDNITLKLIFKEKYIVMMLNTESWVDMRRFDYDYDGFEMPLNAALPDFIRRLAYPSVEISRNGPNVPEISGLDERLWWDM
ncbi:SusD/RagB family nutrient-binding outer membrane lipoprotein [Terrimonas sp.]|uniref:SusD/RagB family nutrient-binding outer membrane lipoprotein n=1 Tax=Terrimonas sp. TaxID=1914338 RepID=UPI000D513F70|nr:SusD/RagB family nutrient-binding outer membrane lipoprotein [Terrimonas sp.]PVD51202.1 SusD/RagB family nutrient-binding outer membrane lipoprotein [Terrimonas sp.]